MSETPEERPVLSVSGTAEAFAPPDEVVVRLGVRERSATAFDAQNRANGVMQNFLQSLEDIGISKQHVQTSRIMLTDIEDPRTGQKVNPPSYQAAIALSVRLSDLDLAGKVIDAGISSGVNTIDGVDFRLRNERPYQLKAYKEAVADARSKADAIAEALGMTITGVDEVSIDGAGHYPRPRAQMMAGHSIGAMYETPLEQGELQVSVTVSIRYWLG